MKTLFAYCFLILISAYSTLCSGFISGFQDIKAIESAVKSHIQDHYRQTEEFELSLTQLDPRLKLASCNQALIISSQSGELKAGRNNIAVQCNNPNKWKIYTVAVIKAYRQVLVLNQNVRRGDFLTPQKLSWKRVNLSLLNHGFISDQSSVINKTAKRHLSAGTVLNNALLEEPKLVRKGEKVTIQTRSPYFHISMTGIALRDGSKHQTIRVRNIKSKRIVQATVAEPGLVYVRPKGRY